MIEKAFLGCIMKENSLIKDTIIHPKHLKEARHQELLRNMIKFHQTGKAIDLISLTTLPNLQYIGGVSYLNELLAFADIEKFNEIEELILEDWKEREKQNLLQIASMQNWSIEKIVKQLDSINQRKVNDHIDLSTALTKVFHLPWEEQEPERLAPTGIQKLDKFIGGFRDGEVTILAARPSMGKTDCMLHFAKEAGWAGYVPIIFSLEMPEKLITTRLIASTGGYNRMKLNNPYQLLSEKQKKRWPEVIGKLSQTNIQIFDHPAQTIPEIRAKLRSVIHQFPDRKPIVFIDYLTLIKPNAEYSGNTHYQVSEISRNLKTMAKDFHCPIVCLAQLNRGVESRAEKRPVMSDIRDSGSVEQDADMILFLYREKYYNRELEDDILEIIIAKNRNGPTGKITTFYNMYTGKIEEKENVDAN